MSDIKSLLLSLLGFDTQNGDDCSDLALRGETKRLLEFVKSRLEKTTCAVVEFQEYEVAVSESKKFGSRGNLVAFLNDGLPKVLLQGHVDTVPFGNFEKNPLGEVNGDVVYGRGCVDMKGSVAAMIVAFEKICLLKNRRYSPVLLLTSDEEARGFAGIKHFLAQNKMKIVFGICGEPTGFKVFNRFKGVMSKTVGVFGRSAHGSRPFLGKNAVYDAVKIVSLLQDFSKFVYENLVDSEFKTVDDASMRSSLNVGKIFGGSKVNVVPEHCSVEFEMRLVRPLEVYESALSEQVLKKIPSSVDFKIVDNFSFAPLFISSDNVFVSRLCGVVKGGVGGCDFGVMAGFSEATFLNINEIATVVFGPGNPAYSHTSNEQALLTDLKLYEGILIGFF